MQKAPMQKADNSTSVLPTILAATMASLLTGCTTISNSVDGLLDRSPVSDIQFSRDDEIEYQGASSFDRRFYGALSAGMSRLEPDTEGADGVDVDKNTDAGGQLAVGADLSKTFTVELHAADLGSAELSPEGTIAYQVGGGSVLMYAGRERAQRRGLMGFGRVGIAATSIEGEGDVNFVTDDSAKGIVGAGVEYMWQNLGVRGEVLVFDKDAQFAHLGVIYRLGGSDSGVQELPDSFPSGQPAPQQQQIPQQPVTQFPPLPDLPEQPQLPEQPSLPDLPSLPELPPLSEEVAQDNDADGVPDQFDNCPTTEFGMEVDATGCALFNGVVDGVNFKRGSNDLTDEAKNVLNGVIRTLKEHPDAMISIAAHTDSRGRDQDNLTLSKARAISVARYMISRGIPKANMSARAFGEYQPIADNETPEGRAINRRVEITATKQGSGF